MSFLLESSARDEDTLRENCSLAKSRRDSRTGTRMAQPGLDRVVRAQPVRSRRSPTSAPSSMPGSTRTIDELAPAYSPPGTLDEHMAQMQRVKSVLFDAGWMRYGWPERVGGLGGSPMLRTELGAALAGRDLTDPGLFSLIEVLAPTLIDFASPALGGRGRPAPALGRRDVVPGVLRAVDRKRPRRRSAAAPFPTATRPPRRPG